MVGTTDFAVGIGSAVAHPVVRAANRSFPGRRGVAAGDQLAMPEVQVDSNSREMKMLSNLLYFDSPYLLLCWRLIPFILIWRLINGSIIVPSTAIVIVAHFHY